MKRKTAKEILAESFREVAESKPIDKITIFWRKQKERISAACGVRQICSAIPVS